MPTTTPNLGLTLPTPNVDTGWGSTLNTDFTLIDDLFAASGAGPSVGINVGAGKTANVGGTLIAGGTVILGSGDGTGTVNAPTIRGAARTGTNVAGSNIQFDAINGTGTGGSGSFLFRTAPVSSSGSVANTMQTVVEIKNTRAFDTYGPLGAGGANYGTLGQVLTSGGSALAPSWADLPVAVSIPTGSVMPYAGATEPSGWLFAFGQTVSRVTYAALFAAIGTTYGAGDGVSTFALPDLRGRVVAGQDDMGGTSANRLTGLAGGVDGDVLGGTGGLETHTLTTAQIPAHTHTSFGASGSGSFYPGGSPGSSGTSSNTGSTGGGGSHNNVQPTIVLNYIIKA